MVVKHLHAAEKKKLKRSTMFTRSSSLDAPHPPEVVALGFRVDSSDDQL